MLLYLGLQKADLDDIQPVSYSLLPNATRTYNMVNTGSIPPPKINLFNQIHPAVSKKTHDMSLLPPNQGLCDLFPDRIEPKDVQAAHRDGSLEIQWYSSLRAELKRRYLVRRQVDLGRDIKHSWTSDGGMAFVADLMPVIHFHRRNLVPFCNKPTILYWELSAQQSSHPFCTGLIFACIYNFGFDFTITLLP